MAPQSHIVVVTTPKFDLHPGVVKIHEPMLVEAFQTDAGIEAFDEGIGVGPFTPKADIQSCPERELERICAHHDFVVSHCGPAAPPGS